MKRDIPLTEEQQMLVKTHLYIVTLVITESIHVNKNIYGFGTNDVKVITIDNLIIFSAHHNRVPCLKALEKNYACLLANHGVVAGAQTLDRAFMVASIVEEGAHVYYLERQSNHISVVPKEAYEAVFKAMQQYGK